MKTTGKLVFPSSGHMLQVGMAIRPESMVLVKNSGKLGLDCRSLLI